MDIDSDHAGCVLSRKSVNLIKARSWTQGTRSWSVAESELHAGVTGASICWVPKAWCLTFAKTLCNVFLVQTAVQPRVGQHGRLWHKGSEYTSLKTLKMEWRDATR